MKFVFIFFLGFCLVSHASQSCDHLVQKAGYRDRVLQLVKTGISAEDDIIAYHGTMIEAIKGLLQTGAMPVGHFEHGSPNSDLKGLYVASASDQFPKYPMKDGVKFTRQDAIREASTYAKSMAPAAHICDRLSISLTDPIYELLRGAIFTSECVLPRPFWEKPYTLHLDDFSEGYSEEIKKYVFGSIDALKKRRLTVSKIRQIFKESVAYKGVLIGLNSKILSERYVDLRLPMEEGIFIFLQDGLPLSYISGIQPLGEADRQFFESLK